MAEPGRVPGTVLVTDPDDIARLLELRAKLAGDLAGMSAEEQASVAISLLDRVAALVKAARHQQITALELMEALLELFPER